MATPILDAAISCFVGGWGGVGGERGIGREAMGWLSAGWEVFRVPGRVFSAGTVGRVV